MLKDTPERRKEIREEIKKSSKEEFILEEMKRLGMWPDNNGKPLLSEHLIKRRGELRREISELSKKNNRYLNRETELNKYKKERLRLSKEKQKLNKQRRKDERLAKAQSRKLAMQKDITYLGKRYSHQLHLKESDLDTLARNHLPITQDITGLSKALNISVSDLRYLSYDRKLNKVSHYQTYGIRKKSGGIRKIAAPKPRLKAAQRAILDNILSKLEPSSYAHGFTPKRSILTNALPHIGAGVVVNMDLKNFFPTIDYKRVYGFYKKLGFSPQIATVLSLICTIPEEEKIKVHGVEWNLNRGTRHLPQGAPTSPMLTNLICRRMDHRMAGIAKNLGFRYTRYADDMTFSGPASARANIKKLKWQTLSVIKDEDFVLHPDKTHIMPNGHRKEVTGIVVNNKINIPRKKLKAFRATLYQIEKDGPIGKSWGDPSVDVLSSIEGYARYIYMVNSDKGKQYLAQVKRIKNKYDPKPKKLFRKKTSTTNTNSGNNGSNGSASKKPWWKLW